MGRHITWYIIALLVTIAMVSILLQVRNFNYVSRLYSEYFETLAQRALDEVSRSLEQDELERQLRSMLSQNEVQSFCLSADDSTFYNNAEECGSVPTSYLSDGSEVWNGYGNPERASCPPWIKAYDNNLDKEHSHVLQSKLLNTYFYHRSLLDEIILHTILERNSRPLKQRVDINFLQRSLVREFSKVGIIEPFEFTLHDHQGQEVFTSSPNLHSLHQGRQSIIIKRDLFVRSNSYLDDKVEEVTLPYIEVAFINHSHNMGNLIYTLPSLATLLVIVVLSVVAINILLRQQRFMRERKDFVSNMTHELKTPVSSIRLACEMLEDSSIEESYERRRRITQTMLKEVDRLTLLVDQVLQSSAMERGVFKIYPVELDAHQEIRDLSSAYVLKLSEIHGELLLNLMAPRHILICDKIAFQNIISNVIDNSIKYCKEDTPPVITITTRNQANSIIIEIQDNGIGISRQDADHIFDQFYRVHTGDRHDVKGFGLGLSYVQRALQAMGGSVQVYSKLGEGTKMSLRIPLVARPKE